MSPNNMSPNVELLKYKCHKEVWAFEIEEVMLDDPSLSDGAQLFGTNDEMLWVEKDYIDKHKPEAGGYLVLYEDGYKSYSPASAFESGYTLIKDLESRDRSIQLATIKAIRNYYHEELRHIKSTDEEFLKTTFAHHKVGLL